MVVNLKLILLALFLSGVCTADPGEEKEGRLTVFTVATEKTDGYARYVRSLEMFNLDLVTLGMGEAWQGGDMNYPAGGWKVNLLKRELEKRKGEQGYMMFTDSYDVIVAAGKDSLLGKFYIDAQHKGTAEYIIYASKRFHEFAFIRTKVQKGLIHGTSHRFCNLRVFFLFHTLWHPRQVYTCTVVRISRIRAHTGICQLSASMSFGDYSHFMYIL